MGRCVAQGFELGCSVCPSGMGLASVCNGMGMVAPWQQCRGGMGTRGHPLWLMCGSRRSPVGPGVKCESTLDIYQLLSIHLVPSLIPCHSPPSQQAWHPRHENSCWYTRVYPRHKSTQPFGRNPLQTTNAISVQNMFRKIQKFQGCKNG